MSELEEAIDVDVDLGEAAAGPSTSDGSLKKYVFQPLVKSKISPAWNFFKTAYIRNKDHKLIPVKRLENKAVCVECVKSKNQLK